MPWVLRDLSLRESELFSVVDKGAGGDDAHRPRIVLIKRRKEQGTMTLQEKIQKALDDIAKLQAEVAKEEPAADPKVLLEQALEGLDEGRIAAIMSAVTAMQQAPPPAAAPPTPPIEPKAEEPPADEPPKPPEDEKKAGDDNPEDMEKIMKDLTPEARALVEKAMKAGEDSARASGEEIAKLKKDNEDIGKRLGETEDIVAKQAAEKEHAEMVEVAKTFPSLPGDYGERATTLLKVKKADPKGYEATLEILKSAEELSKKGLRESGTTRTDMSGDSAEAKIESMTKVREDELVKEGMSRTKAHAKAYREVSKANTEIFNEAEAERQ